MNGLEGIGTSSREDVRVRIFRVVSVSAIVGMLLVVPGTATAAGAPTATTGAATAIGSTSATLNASVSPNKQSTTVSFQYGKTTAYGLTASAGTVNGNASKSVSAAIDALTAGTL